MSDNPAVEPTDPTGAAPEAVPIQSEAPAQEPAIDWKAEARKWEQRAKENSTAAQRLAELEEAQKTEAQKLADRLAAAEKALAEKEAEALRLTVAAKHGITGDYLDLVHGSDEASLEASASKVAALLNAQQAASKPSPLIVPAESKTPPALNSSALEDALRKAVGAY